MLARLLRVSDSHPDIPPIFYSTAPGPVKGGVSGTNWPPLFSRTHPLAPSAQLPRDKRWTHSNGVIEQSIRGALRRRYEGRAG